MYVFIVSSQLLVCYIAQLYINLRHIVFKVDENDCSGQNDLVFKWFVLGSFTLDRKKSISLSLYCLNLCGELILHFRYASLYFCCAVEDQENELITLEIIHRYVELLDKYFGSVSVFMSAEKIHLSPITCPCNVTNLYDNDSKKYKKTQN